MGPGGSRPAPQGLAPETVLGWRWAWVSGLVRTGLHTACPVSTPDPVAWAGWSHPAVGAGLEAQVCGQCWEPPDPYLGPQCGASLPLSHPESPPGCPVAGGKPEGLCSEPPVPGPLPGASCSPAWACPRPAEPPCHRNPPTWAALGMGWEGPWPPGGKFTVVFALLPQALVHPSPCGSRSGQEPSWAEGNPAAPGEGAWSRSYSCPEPGPSGTGAGA